MSGRPQVILALDPSSTRIGYALWDVAKRRPVELGFLTPDTDTGSRATAGARIESLIGQLDRMLRVDNLEGRLERILVEVPVGKQWARCGKRTSGLPVWAFAAGAVWGMLRWRGKVVHRDGTAGYVPVEAIPATWTQGSTKAGRQVAAAALCREYQAGLDPGGDMADALMMVEFWAITAGEEG